MGAEECQPRVQKATELADLMRIASSLGPEGPAVVFETDESNERSLDVELSCYWELEFVRFKTDV